MKYNKDSDFLLKINPVYSPLRLFKKSLFNSYNLTIAVNIHLVRTIFIISHEFSNIPCMDIIKSSFSLINESFNFFTFSLISTLNEQESDIKFT